MPLSSLRKRPVARRALSQTAEGPGNGTAEARKPAQSDVGSRRFRARQHQGDQNYFVRRRYIDDIGVYRRNARNQKVILMRSRGFFLQSMIVSGWPGSAESFGRRESFSTGPALRTIRR